MEKTAKLQVELYEGWINYSDDNPDGGPTFVRTASYCPGPLQVSYALYTKGKIPNPSKDDLLNMAKKFGAEKGFGDLLESRIGDCAFGIYGTAVFKSEKYPRFQIWHISNGKDFIFATHICPKDPDEQEIVEVNDIVLKMNLKYIEKPWWKL